MLGAPLLALTCAEPHATELHEQLRRGGRRDPFVLSKLAKLTERHAPDTVAPSWNTMDLS